MQKIVASSLAMLLVAGSTISPIQARAASNGSTTTPIKHLVVIFQENVSFDHYFGTYPNATNPARRAQVHGRAGNADRKRLYRRASQEQSQRPEHRSERRRRGQPFRLDRSQAATADQDHDYTPEQEAFDHGLMDGFPKYTGTPGPPPTAANHHRPGDGLLRRQHSDRFLELCAALCDER